MTKYVDQQMAANTDAKQAIQEWARIKTFLDERWSRAILYIADLKEKFSRLDRYCYISLICSHQKQGTTIIDYIQNIDHTLQLEYIGFTYQAIALNSIGSAYPFYVKKEFYRSIDGITYLPSKEKPIYFTGEGASSYLFVKRVIGPYMPLLKGGKKITRQARSPTAYAHPSKTRTKS